MKVSNINLNMTVSSILVIYVIIKLQHRVIFSNIFSLSMKVSSFPVINVIIKLHNKLIFRDIFSLYMKVSSILVISVIIKLHNRVIFRLTLQQSTAIILSIVQNVQRFSQLTQL